MRESQGRPVSRDLDIFHRENFSEPRLSPGPGLHQSSLILCVNLVTAEHLDGEEKEIRNSTISQV